MDELINVDGFSEHGSPEAVGQLYAALAEAQGEYEPIARTKQVKIQSQKGSYSFEYAEMDEINTAIKAAHKKHGLALIAPFSRADAQGTATHHVILSKGGARLHVRYGFVPGADVKDLGGQTTYLMRYLVSKLLRLHAEGDADDQPSAARGETSAETKKLRQEPPKPPPPKAVSCTRCGKPVEGEPTFNLDRQPFHQPCYAEAAAEFRRKAQAAAKPADASPAESKAAEAVAGPADTGPHPGGEHTEPIAKAPALSVVREPAPTTVDDLYAFAEGADADEPIDPATQSMIVLHARNVRWNQMRMTQRFEKLFPGANPNLMTQGQGRVLAESIKREAARS